jgi:hypothetical protein
MGYCGVYDCIKIDHTKMCDSCFDGHVLEAHMFGGKHIELRDLSDYSPETKKRILRTARLIYGPEKEAELIGNRDRTHSEWLEAYRARSAAENKPTTSRTTKHDQTKARAKTKSQKDRD